MGLEPLPIKPGSTTKAAPRYNVVVLDSSGNVLPPDTEGSIAIGLPLPPGTFPTLWQNDKKYEDSYLSLFPGYYFTGDGGYIDRDGYIYVIGRIDDVINVAGHRLSTGAMEEVIATHPDVAECAVVGVTDDFKGQLPLGFIVLKSGGNHDNQTIINEVIQMVRDRIGAVACFRKALVVKVLPKTRSGKILRGLMRKIADGENTIYHLP